DERAIRLDLDDLARRVIGDIDVGLGEEAAGPHQAEDAENPTQHGTTPEMRVLSRKRPNDRLRLGRRSACSYSIATFTGWTKWVFFLSLVSVAASSSASLRFGYSNSATFWFELLKTCQTTRTRVILGVRVRLALGLAGAFGFFFFFGASSSSSPSPSPTSSS